jgi:hypothetical protein
MVPSEQPGGGTRAEGDAGHVHLTTVAGRVSRLLGGATAARPPRR